MVAPDTGDPWRLGRVYGEGRKTVIPAQAHAKISFRIVPGQNPAKAVAALHRHIAAHTPADASIKVTSLGEEGGIEIPTDSRWMRAVQAALAAEYGSAALLGGCGGSLPVVGKPQAPVGHGHVALQLRSG